MKYDKNFNFSVLRNNGDGRVAKNRISQGTKYLHSLSINLAENSHKYTTDQYLQRVRRNFEYL